MRSEIAIRNFGASGGNFVITALLNFWFTPYLVGHLGVEAYGLVPLAMQVTSYMTLATLALNAATSRFVMQAITQGDHDKAARLFNTAVFATIGLVALLVIPAAYVAFNIDNFINVPESLHRDARWLFIATFAAFLIGALRSPFEVSMFCRNRLDIQNGISALDTVVKVATTVLLFWLAYASLGNVGVGIFAASLSTALLSVAAWRILTPSLNIDSGMWDKAMLKPLISVGGWSVVNQVGSILFLSVDLVIANRYLGVSAAGIYAALLVWPMMIRIMAGYIGVNFTPSFVELHAKGEHEKLAKYGILSVRITSLLTVGPVIVLSALSAPLLNEWLGTEWVQHQYLLGIMLLNLIFNVPVISLFGLLQATTNMKVLGLATLATGFMNVATAVLLSTQTSLGLWGIALAGIVWFNIKNAIFLPVYVKHVLGSPEFTVTRLYLALGPGILAGGIVWIAIRLYIENGGSIQGWLDIGFIAMVAEMAFLGLFFLMPGTTREREYVVHIIHRIQAKLLGK